MPEKEQRILLQDAYEVNKHAETLPEMKLTLAMRKGMERGKMREKRRFYFWSTGTVMALAAALLIINYSIGSLAHRAEPAPKQTAGIPPIWRVWRAHWTGGP